MNRTNSNSWYH